MKIHYSNEPTNRIYVKGYGFLSFAKNMSTKFSQKLFDSGIYNRWNKNYLTKSN